MTSTSFSSRGWLLRVAAAVGPWVGVIGLASWASRPVSGWLLVAATGAVASAVGRWRRPVLYSLGVVVLLGGILAGFAAHRQTSRLRADWPTYWAHREEAVGERLDADLQDVLAAGESAADLLADLGSEPAALPAQERLVRLRERFGLSALALYGPSGELRVWEGEHRGPVPDEVQRGIRRIIYRDRPLFGYLYVTAPAGGAGTAVAAFLLRSDLPGTLGADAGDFASDFRRRVGENVRIFPASLAEGQGGWELEMGGRVLLSVVVEPPRPPERIEATLERWRLLIAALAILAWICLALAGGRNVMAGATSAAVLVVLAMVLPVPEAPWTAGLFDPGWFRLPGPLPLPLGRITLVALAALTVVAVVPRPRVRLPAWVAAGLVGVLFPALLAWLRGGVAPGALAEGEAVWLAYQGTAAAVLALVAGTGMSMSAGPGRRRFAVAGAVAVSLLLSAGSLTFLHFDPTVPAWYPALWALPAWWIARSLDRWTDWRRVLAAWALGAVLASTAAIPQAWSDRIEAQRFEGSARLARLAAADDPALEADLRSLAAVSDSLDAAGTDGVELLYRALRRSTLAGGGHPIRLTLWSAGRVPGQELRVGVGPDRPSAADAAAFAETGPGPTLLTYDRSDARYVMRVPLREGRVLTATAPPFSPLATRTPLSPLLSGGALQRVEPLTLIPQTRNEASDAGLRWARVESGWQGELAVVFPDAAYHAHYMVEIPTVPLALARGALLLVLDLVLVLGFWVVGRILLRDLAPGGLGLGRWAVTFRARVTLALFGFFVLANAIFGTLAYRTIDGAAHRTTQVLAERMAEDAAGWYFEESGAMELLSRRVGAELLEYRGGELREGSVGELVELGLYEGWIPPSIKGLLDGREGVRASVETSLGEWEYVTSYRRLPDGDLLAAQVPLQAGATALRSSDVLELGGFAVLLGGALSLGLALLVGRALTRPIQALQVASERVGAGNLTLSLPDQRADEFGEVFQAFNRMVKRLQRARRQLVRTSRRTQAIMDEAAVGMVALDPGGRVTLVNPRGEELLGGDVSLGSPLSPPGALGDDLREWLGGFLGSDNEEAGYELLDGDRRVRIRARRLDTTGAAGGVVLALEDVTDDLRTERVLAWGEMARQVAHEVKNPLTPMKLSIQHIRRAWDDSRPDFGEILTRNADAMLTEIDRLAAIAGSFSRFGAPASGGSRENGPVDVASVVGDVLTLYGASSGPVRFEADVLGALPPARASVAELKEVLVNLLENARDAVRERGGTVCVRAYPVGRDRVALDVVDDGDGIPEDLMPRVFEPHFSTRSGGTGLGLAIVRRLVESWGGTVSVESTGGEGTRVGLLLRRWIPPQGIDPGHEPGERAS